MSTGSPNILIATSSYDWPVIQPVAEALTKHGYSPLVYEADQVTKGEKHLAIHVGSLGMQVVYDGHEISNRAIAAAWLRRPSSTDALFSEGDHAKYLWLNHERVEIQNAVWDHIAEHKWLNSPRAMRLGANKISQLAAAQALGFTIPETVISNSRLTIHNALPPDDRILKMNNAWVTTQAGHNAHYTSVVPYDADRLPDGFPYPGIWQRRIRKTKEWRVTVVDDEVFDAAIYISDEASVDWRHSQNTPFVEFKAERFPDTQKLKCIEMLKYLGLRYGAFDFMEEPDGRIIFTELNVNGQYAWLEDRLGLQISEAITSWLIKTAQTTE